MYRRAGQYGSLETKQLKCILLSSKKIQIYIPSRVFTILEKTGKASLPTIQAALLPPIVRPASVSARLERFTFIAMANIR